MILGYSEALDIPRPNHAVRPQNAPSRGLSLGHGSARSLVLRIGVWPRVQPLLTL
jgi:hypothetical protein